MQNMLLNHHSFHLTVMTTDTHIYVCYTRHSVLISRLVAYESFSPTPLKETVALNHLFCARRAREDKVSFTLTKSYSMTVIGMFTGSRSHLLDAVIYLLIKIERVGLDDELLYLLFFFLQRVT